MNIKALLLGSVATMMATGAVQAADLPVAEPVDYVKVCDAYGSGYFFLPGTNTCMKVSGYVRAEARFYENESSGSNTGSSVRGDDKFNIWSRGRVNFDAREETELGTLSSLVRLEGSSDGNIYVDKAWLSLGGFYAGYVTSASVIDYVGDMYGDSFDLGDTTVGAIGYNLDLGNGVSAHVAIEDNKHLDPAYNNTVAAGWSGWAGQSVPTLAGRVSVSQGWGEASVGGILTQLSYGNAAHDEDFAYAVAAGGRINLDMLSSGSNIALNGFYSKGALGWVGISDGDLLGDVSVNAAGNYELNEAMGVAGSLKYAFAENLWAVVSGGYAEFDDKGSANSDYDLWQSAFEVAYKPVDNLTVKAGIQYTDTEFDSAGMQDSDVWAGKIRFQRDF